MNLRPVFAMLIALAMLFAPSAMQSGSARAAMPSAHAQVMDAAHCPGETGNVDQSAGHSCCAAMCAGAALAPAMAADFRMLTRNDDQPAIEQFGASHLAKLPTPPPRIA